MTRLYCFINGKIKKEFQKIESDTNVAKTGNSAFFRGKQQIQRQTANSTMRWDNQSATEYCWPWWYTAASPAAADIH